MDQQDRVEAAVTAAWAKKREAFIAGVGTTVEAWLERWERNLESTLATNVVDLASVSGVVRGFHLALGAVLSADHRLRLEKLIDAYVEEIARRVSSMAVEMEGE